MCPGAAGFGYFVAFVAPRISTNETRMNTNEYSEMQELVGIRVPGEAGFVKFVVFVSPRISPNETRIEHELILHNTRVTLRGNS